MGDHRLDSILQYAVRQSVSDIHLKNGRVPSFRRHGHLIPHQSAPTLDEAMLMDFVESICSAKQLQTYQTDGAVDVGYEQENGDRFRLNIFSEGGVPSIVIRTLVNQGMSAEDLLLPAVIDSIAKESRGMIVVTGASGSGKSTTVAHLVDQINESRDCHILTIEDPIEFRITPKKSWITQREVGIDTPTFTSALRSALRQDPDVIMVGEMRDVETARTALQAAETGHLVITTLHTINAVETINRITSMFPADEQNHVRMLFASVVKAIVSQRLIGKSVGSGRVPAVEVLIGTELVRELIQDPYRLPEILNALEDGNSTYGMQSFDQSLMDLYKRDVISYEEALKQSSNPADFALKISGISGTSGNRWNT